MHTIERAKRQPQVGCFWFALIQSLFIGGVAKQISKESRKCYDTYMRARITVEELESFLQAAKGRLGKPWEYLAREICNIHPRTLKDWRRGKYTPSLDVLEKLAAAAEIALPSTIQQLDKYWYIPRAAQLGGQKTYQLYGPLGTPKGRSLGGSHAMAVRLARGDQLALAKEIFYPRRSKKLAEFIGIVLGDGGINPFQVTISLHRVDDREYVGYVVKLIEELFHVTPALSFREAVCSVVVSRVKLVTFLKNMGLPIGSKVRHQVCVPSWITADDEYSRRCIRGLMDTDGSFYVDKHRYKEKIYLNPALNFSNHSLPLLQFYKQKLEKFGFSPTQTTPFGVFLRKEPQIAQYFKEIGSSNQKIIDRYLRYLQGKLIKRL